MSLKDVQKQLLELNVNEYTDKKGNIVYLSWANAWQEVLKVYPDADYEIMKDENRNSYFGNSEIGYMVYTTVTIEGKKREMWLSVMDYKNNAILNPTMTDINKSIMRCLTKNLAMFGLGLYIYAGEDLPQEKDMSDDIKAELDKITTLEDLQKYFKDNKSKYPASQFNKLVSDKKKELV